MLLEIASTVELDYLFMLYHPLLNHLLLLMLYHTLLNLTSCDFDHEERGDYEHYNKVEDVPPGSTSAAAGRQRMRGMAFKTSFLVLAADAELPTCQATPGRFLSIILFRASKAILRLHPLQ